MLGARYRRPKMPTYEYRCEKCPHEEEHFAQHELPIYLTHPCPGCGGRLKRRLGVGSVVIFKGSGFHCTDYRKVEL